ncbi:hypothetical protein BJ508DRAFT_348576 [Ascobolus immersus RN42]|uniref:Uncharacterized protein n=1 Tax=Ascobolus immersus RN42 TaxID=1160509 RepID=A0A3N4IBL1_ASCIM|nr:hypothetical protein BJ508DRAFT_348576 [Ascobolus immersus RN42]
MGMRMELEEQSTRKPHESVTEHEKISKQVSLRVPLSLAFRANRDRFTFRPSKTTRRICWYANSSSIVLSTLETNTLLFDLTTEDASNSSTNAGILPSQRPTLNFNGTTFHAKSEPQEGKHGRVEWGWIWRRQGGKAMYEKDLKREETWHGCSEITSRYGLDRS